MPQSKQLDDFRKLVFFKVAWVRSSEFNNKNKVPTSLFQLWARYLKGDNISTKIGSGRVEIDIGIAIPTFDKSGSGSGRATRLFEILRQFGIN